MFQTYDDFIDMFQTYDNFIDMFQTYDDFIDMAERGNQYNVSQSLNSMEKKDAKEGEDDPYHKMSELEHKSVIFSFGNAVFEDRGEYSNTR